MEEYGPSVHLSQHRDSKPVKDDSWRRKFRRWNPTFFEHFFYDPETERWEPNLGPEGEKNRRQAIREGHAKSPDKKRKGTSKKSPPSPVHNTRNLRHRKDRRVTVDDDEELDESFLYGEEPAQIKSASPAKREAKRQTKLHPAKRTKRGRPNPEPTGLLVAQGEDELFCTIWERKQDETHGPIGFVILPSPRTASFGEIREAIDAQVGLKDDNPDWTFFIPHLGPVSRVQEQIFGPVLSFLEKRHLPGDIVGRGTLKSPLRIHVSYPEVHGDL